MNDKLNIQNLIDSLAEKHGIDKKVADGFVKGFFSLIEEGLEKDRYVKIKGLGTFKLIDVESRESINVNTGERFEIQGHTKISFTPDSSLKEVINRPFAHFETVPLNENTVFEDMPMINEDVEEESPDQPESANEDRLEQSADADADEMQEPAKEIESMTEPDGMSDSTAGHLTEPTEPATGSTEIDETVTAQETAEPAVESDEFDGPAQETEMSSESAADTKEAGTDGLTMEMEKERTDDDAEKAQPTEGTSEAEPASLQRESSKQPDAFSSSISMKHLVYILLLFMLLCGGVVLYLYFPDLFANKDLAENDAVEIVNETLAVGKNELEENTVTDSIAVTDRAPAVAPDTIQPQPVRQKTETAPKSAVKSEKGHSSAVKEEKPTVPFVTDSVSYTIVGTQTNYTIKEGETLTRVALRFYGTKSLWPYLVKHNPNVIKNPNNVPYGTTIKIPKLVKKK